jgi:hypothetical protein
VKTYPVGTKFGSLTSIALFEQPGKPYIRFLCLCDCGTLKDYYKDNLVRGYSTSCGCRRKEVLPSNFVHGAMRLNKHNYSTFRAWTAMKQRCYNHKDPQYSEYGGRGITICERWRENFLNFLADMGPRPEGRHGNAVAFSIDRFPNNNGNYEPSNCRWATWIEQNNNRRPAKTNRWKKLRGE